LPQFMAFKQAGYEVYGVCSNGPNVEFLREKGLTIYPITILRRVSPLRDMKALIQLVWLLRRHPVEIVHTHTPKAAFLGQLAAMLARIPIRVNTIHGLYYVNQTNGLKRWLFKTLEVAACRLASHVFSQSQEDVDVALEEGLIAENRLEYLGNGLNTDHFCRERFPADEGSQVREEFGIPENAFVVGIVARMVHEKGLLELFDAFANLRRSVPSAYLLHIGPVDKSRNAHVTPETARDHGIEEYCRFLGLRRDVPRLLTAIDVYCLPSHREGYPRSVMEANAMSLPAVVTDIRGCREAVVDGENGLIVPVRDPDALAAALIRLFQDTSLRKRLAEGARRRAVNVFDERRVFEIILDAYERLLRSRNLPVPTA